MNLCFVCKSCKQSNFFTSFCNDRIELSKKKGDNVSLKCNKCGEIHDYHVNKIFASSSRLINISLFLIMITITAYLIYYLFVNYWEKSFYMVFVLPMAAAIPSMIYFTYLKAHNKKINNFNKFRK